MKLPAALALALAGLTFTGEMAWADPMVDVCRERAKEASGNRGLTRSVGKVQMRLSGSVAIGASRSSGAQSGSPPPAFAGQGEMGRQEDAAQAKYTRIYDDCMRAR